MRQATKNALKRWAPGLLGPASALRLSVVQPLGRARQTLDRRTRAVASLGATSLGMFRYWRALLGPHPVRVQSEAPHIVMLVVSDLRIDPRVLRSATALAKAGYRITVICPDLSTPPLSEQPLDWGPGIEFRPLPWRAASFVMHFPWLFGDLMHDAASAERPFAFHCHDLTTAVVGLSAARRVGAYCICDFHEWYRKMYRGVQRARAGNPIHCSNARRIDGPSGWR